MKDIEKRILDKVNSPCVIIFLSSLIGVAIWMVAKVNLSGDWIYHYSKWMEELKGGITDSAVQIVDYPLGFLFFLFVAAKTPISPYLAFRLMALPFYFLTAFASYLIVKALCHDKYYASIGYAMIMLLPSVFLNVSVWGQVDVMYIGFLVLAVFLMLREKFGAAFFIVGVAFSFKQSAILFFPVIALLYFRSKKVSIIHIVNILWGYIVMSLPACCLGGGGQNFTIYLRDWEVTDKVLLLD